MTSVAELGQGRLHRALLRASRALHALVTTRQRAVLPLYRPQRSPRWKLVSGTLLLGFLGFIAVVYGLLSAVMPLQIMMLMSAPLAIVALLVIWALPEAGRIPAKSLSRVFFAFFIIIIAWPNYFSLVLPGLPWISLRRTLGGLTTVLLLVSLSTSRDFRRRLWAVASTEKWFIRFLLGFLALQLLSTAVNQPAFLFGPMLDIHMTWTAMFFTAAWFFSTTRRVRIWIVALLVVAVALIVMSFFEYRAGQVLWANHIPSFLHVDEAFVEGVLTPRFRGVGYRVITVFNNPLTYGEFLAFVAPFILYFLMNARTRWQFVFWGGMDLLLGVGALISSARLSVIGFLVAHIFYLLLWAIRRWRADRGGLIGPALTLMYPALLAVAVVLTLTVDAVHNRVLGGGATQASNVARTEQLALGLPAIAKSPIIGYGLGGGGVAIGWRMPNGQISVDNYYLAVAADYGVPGLILFFGMILILIWVLARDALTAPGPGMPLTAAMATLLGVFMTIRTVYSQPDNNPLFFICLGLAVALLHDAKNGRKIAV